MPTIPRKALKTLRYIDSLALVQLSRQINGHGIGNKSMPSSVHRLLDHIFRTGN